MYTVMRFRNSDADGIRRLRDEAVRRFGEDRVGPLSGETFSCDVSHASEWTSHQEEIVAYVTHNASWIRECKGSGTEDGVEVWIDIALFPKDRGPGIFFCISFSRKLLHILLGVGVLMEVTVYKGTK